jgi:hypothetical protein
MGGAVGKGGSLSMLVGRLGSGAKLFQTKIPAEPKTKVASPARVAIATFRSGLCLGGPTLVIRVLSKNGPSNSRDTQHNRLQRSASKIDAAVATDPETYPFTASLLAVFHQL